MDTTEFINEHPEFVLIDHDPHIQQVSISCAQCGHQLRQGGPLPQTQLLYLGCNHCSVQGILLLQDDCRHIIGYVGSFDFTAV